ncbi:uncharacterized protein BDR25DRAFT_384564, partial [Lindgomyces ingoldianus]
MLHPTAQDISYWQAHLGDDRRSWFVGLNATFLVLAYVAVSLRFLSRLKIGTKIGLDDWLICCAAVKFQTSLIAQTFYNLCTPTIKLSILALYSRIFCRTHGWFTPTLYLTAIFVFLYTVPQCFAYIFQCVPIESLWKDLGPGGKVYCINFQAVIVTFGIVNILTDWWILALPVPVVIGLQLERRTKWSICTLFLLGGFVCVISIIRLIYARKVETADPSWDYVPISLISTIECSSGILAACMPTWRPLFKFLRHGIGSYFSNGNNKS